MLKGDCYYLSILSVIANSALLVQLVERRFPKPDVEGSSPSGRVIYYNGEVAEWLKASDC